MLECEGVPYQLHYLDDFLLLAPPNSPQGSESLSITLQAFARLGIPIATHKTEGPTTSLVFLGILIDTEKFELRLPADKLLRLQQALQHWVARRTCTRRELESLIGHLSHAATVVPQRRVFLRQLFSLLSLNRAPHHYLRINAGAIADLMRWKFLLQDWNGTSFFPARSSSIEVFSDASGTFSCGAFSLSYGWFQLQWPPSWQDIHITAKELVPIVISAAIWGPQWARQGINFRCDNMAVVSLLKSKTSQDPLLMHMIRCLVFYPAFYGFQITSNHIPGVLNTAADALSRNNLSLFHSLVSQGPRAYPPQAVMDLLINLRPDWGSQASLRLFTLSLIKDYPLRRGQSTGLGGVDT